MKECPHCGDEVDKDDICPDCEKCTDCCDCY